MGEMITPAEFKVTAAASWLHEDLPETGKTQHGAAGGRVPDAYATELARANSQGVLQGEEMTQ